LPALLLAFNCAHDELLSVDNKQTKIKVAVSASVDSIVGHLEGYKANIDYTPTSSVPDKAIVTFVLKI
jgi:hypothetical protein